MHTIADRKATSYNYIELYFVTKDSQNSNHQQTNQKQTERNKLANIAATYSAWVQPLALYHWYCTGSGTLPLPLPLVLVYPAVAATFSPFQ